MEIVPFVTRLRAFRRNGRYDLLGDPEHGEEDMVLRPDVPSGSAYIKISDGCNAPCAFCSIPSFKGKLRSRPLPAIVDEAEALVRGGAKELVVVAQDTTDYGRDAGEPDSLPRLLSAICHRVPELRWLRLMYAYPGHVSDRLIEVMASEPQIVPYLDIPLQHGHPATLRRMRRPSNPSWVLGTVEKLRQAMADIALRTTFIVGYPGETEEEFQGLLDLMEQVRFDRVGVFRFSPEPGTPAATLPDQVPDEISEERWHRVMALQQSISLASNQAQIGRQLDVLVEGFGELDRDDMAPEEALAVPTGQLVSLARSYRDAPEVDGLVLIPGKPLPLGQMTTVQITGALTYDLIGELRAGATTAGPVLAPAVQLALIGGRTEVRLA
jgi:ribosomal protein S12 methylthiotransferase